uniref:Uncharacterized protein n=1 Tax=Oryza punctata TaxID=4537 RepID=A0A0E0L9G5_ORYPU
MAPQIPIFFFFLLALAAGVRGETGVGVGDGNVEYNCVYTVFVRTGSAWKGGTDSTIGPKQCQLKYTPSDNAGGGADEAEEDYKEELRASIRFHR